MNALKVSQSRFAVLRIEDDDISEPVSPSKTAANKAAHHGKKVNNNNNTGGVNSNSPVSAAANKAKKKKKPQCTAAIIDTSSSPCSSAKSVGKTTTKSSDKSQVAAKKQWEEWKAKDSKFVSEVFEQDLQQALLQSKLEFEERKKQIAEQRSGASGQHNSSYTEEQKKKKAKKKEKPSAMSLEEFHNMNGSEDCLAEQVAHLKAPQQMAPQPATNEKDFFCEIEKDVERILQREHIRDSVRAIDVQKGDKLLCLQHEKEIKEKEEQVKELTAQVQKALEELKLVKTRNKKLCGILGQAEIREKAEILVQVDQLTQVKDELTQQVSELHVALEQEKSKVHSLQLELKRYQESKKGGP